MVEGAYKYAGQYEDVNSGFIFMNARYYDPNIGLFISPDTLIPDPLHLMDYNRYMYARGNPVSNNDPSGHVPCNDAACYNAHGLFDRNNDGAFTDPGIADFTNAGPGLVTAMMNEAGIAFVNETGRWAPHEVMWVLQGIVAYANKLSNFNNETGLIQLNQMLGDHITYFNRMSANNFFGAAAHVGKGRLASAEDTASGGNSIVSVYNSFFSSADFTRGSTVHELAHVADFNAIPPGNLSATSPMDPNFNAGTYINTLRNAPWWHFVTDNTLRIEYYAELQAIWVFSPPTYGNNNPYGDIRNSEPQIP